VVNVVAEGVEPRAKEIELKNKTDRFTGRKRVLHRSPEERAKRVMIVPASGSW
jgi:hypothetical protein